MIIKEPKPLSDSFTYQTAKRFDLQADILMGLGIGVEILNALMPFYGEREKMIVSILLVVFGAIINNIAARESSRKLISDRASQPDVFTDPNDKTARDRIDARHKAFITSEQREILESAERVSKQAPGWVITEEDLFE